MSPCSCVTLQHQLNTYFPTAASGEKKALSSTLSLVKFQNWLNKLGSLSFRASAWHGIIFNLHRMKSSHDSLTSPILSLPSLLRLKLPKLLHLPNLWSKAQIFQKSHIIQCFPPPTTYMHTKNSTHCSPNGRFALLHDLDKPFLPVSYSGLKAPIYSWMLVYMFYSSHLLKTHTFTSVEEQQGFLTFREQPVVMSDKCW